MRHRLAAAILLASCAGLAGWKARDVRDKAACGYLTKDIPAFKGYLQDLPAHEAPIPPALLSTVYACWAERHDVLLGKDVRWTPVLRLKDARQLTRSHYLLAFELWGTADKSLLVVVDDADRAAGAYWYPYTI